MKYLKATAIGTMIAISLSGCVVSGNGNGGAITQQEKEELKEATDEAYDSLEEVEGIFGEVRDRVFEEVQNELEEINWANELFANYYPEESNKPIVITAGTYDDLHGIEDTKEFFDGLDIWNWELMEDLPTELDTEYVFIFDQPETEMVIKNNSVGYIEIARMEIYKDTNYVKLSLFPEFSQTKFGKSISAESLSSIYELPDEDASFLRNMGAGK
ncbi:hypothetical protein IMSAG049_00139 [Clostridiales bacterium]|nr:hypothetical protein IMSAG049_00139 [Clostridiales bacterium]